LEFYKQEIYLDQDLKNCIDIDIFLRSEIFQVGYVVSGKVTTLEDWKKTRRMRKISYIGVFFSMTEFFFLRFLSKFYLFKSIYCFLGVRQFMSKAEVLGRFIYNGFDILSFVQESGNHSFIIKKVSLGLNQEVSSGLFITLYRLGLNGKYIRVYKIRTMHAYSEFIHKYMIVNHGFDENGKIRNDFRITKLGRFLRKFWIDEIPQIFNLLKGDLKIVGIRPVGEAYFNQLPEEVKEKRLQFKPGCIPPYVSLNMHSNVEEVLKADEIYMNEYSKNRFVDFRYFFLAIYCIIVRRKRSS